MATWDPTSYLRFSDERSRPFFDLVSRVGATAPRRVVDLGCGPGHLTAALADRWPDAEVVGVDSSPEMIEAAQEPDAPVDVVVSNAAMQWVPTHRAVLPRLVDALADG